MQKLDLGEIQAIETDILNEIDRVCRELTFITFSPTELSWEPPATKASSLGMMTWISSC